MERPFQPLTLDEIKEINRRLVAKYGGLFSESDGNFLNRGSLEYILEASISTIFGEELYKTVFTKIAAIVQAIVCEHIFHDGNKRTGLAVAQAALAINGFALHPTLKDNDFIVRIADENLSVEDIAEWLEYRATS